MKRSSFLLLLCLHGCLQASALGENIARQAKVKVSSSTDSLHEARQAVDGNIRIHDAGEWRSTGSVNFYGQIDYPSIELNWNKPVTVSEVVLYDRPTPQSHTAGGILHFSDGSQIQVFEIPNDGSPKSVRFPDKQIEWLRFETTDADGSQVGLS